MEMISSIRNLHVYDTTLQHFNDTEQVYLEYLKKLEALTNQALFYFLSTLKNRELVNNQETENENSFLIELYKMSHKTTSIDTIVKILEDRDIDEKAFVALHKIIIKGTSDDDPKNYHFRKDNDKWVGTFNIDGSKDIDYQPPEYTEIKDYVEYILDYLASKNVDINDNVFLKPLIAHAIIAYLQPFGNGNTRFARLIQHGIIWRNTNMKWNFDFKLPAIYVSKNYALTRGQYRQTLRDLSITKSDDDWNKWFKYNLNMFDEQLYMLNNNLDEYQYMLKRI